MKIRTAMERDIKEIAKVEAKCFPPAEAASLENFRKRVEVYPDHFWLLEHEGKILAFINGMVTNEETIQDEMFENARLHEKDEKWQAIFGVCTLPKYQGKGYAAMLMEQVIADAKAQGRQGCILTCKKELIPYYEKFGYRNEGISDSVHGNAVWYDMRLKFE